MHPTQGRTQAQGGARAAGLRQEPTRLPVCGPGLHSTCPALPPSYSLGLRGRQSPARSISSDAHAMAVSPGIGGRGELALPLPSPPLPLVLLPIAPTPSKHRHRHKRVCIHTHPHTQSDPRGGRDQCRWSLSQDPAPILRGGGGGTRRHMQRHVPSHGRGRAVTPRPAGTQPSLPSHPPAVTATEAGAHVLSLVHPGRQAQTDTTHCTAGGSPKPHLPGQGDPQMCRRTCP